MRPPTRLFGRELAHNDTYQVWALHAWVWQNNAGGTFADWNPRVTC